jgi:adenine phosphoribosyltransferase
VFCSKIYFLSSRCTAAKCSGNCTSLIHSQDPALHESLIRALELHILDAYGVDNKPDIILGLDARGFLFGPSLALRVGAGFVPVRKKGKLPGPTETASFEKEYGADFFQIQSDAINRGQKVIVLDDIIATGMHMICSVQVLYSNSG